MDAIKDDSGGSPGTTLSAYTYLGGGRIVVEDYQQPDVKLNYDSGTAGTYDGLDRFGRVVEHLWYDYGASANRDQFTYGYDRASNRLYRENTVASTQDEFYTYDEVNRLATFDRGDLNVNKDAITGTPVKEEDWGLDMTGNWSDFLQKTSGSTDLNQDRTHNEVNEISGISETTGTAWIDPVHDRCGNMTTLPKPSSPATGLTCTWDAWHRLVEVKQSRHGHGAVRIRRLHRRVKSHVDSAESGQSQRRGCLCALLLQPGLAGAGVAASRRARTPGPNRSSRCTSTCGRSGTSTPRSCGTRTPTPTGCATTPATTFWATRTSTSPRSSTPGATPWSGTSTAPMGY